MAKKKTTKRKVTRKVAKRKATKKVTKKVTKKKTTRRRTAKQSHEIVVKVQAEPTVSLKDLLPVKGKNKKHPYSITKTWMDKKQVMHMLQRTPPQHVHRRKGRGGIEFDYVTGTYVKKVLNYVFGWNWDFTIVNEEVHGSQIVVRGRLTVKDSEGNEVTKEQYGGADIKKLKAGGTMDIGNDFKAAATDALKKCASELGFASDIYGKNEFRDIGRQVNENGDAPKLPAPKDGIHCEGYNKDGCPGSIVLTHTQADYSRKIYRKMLCSTCQHTLKTNAK